MRVQPRFCSSRRDPATREQNVQCLYLTGWKRELRGHYFPCDALFDFDSAELRSEASEVSTALGAGIARRTPTRVRVEAHTDAKASDASNQDLSERRAASVADYLTAGAGIGLPSSSVEVPRCAWPVAPNTMPDGSNDPDGRAQNRRGSYFGVAEPSCEGSRRHCCGVVSIDIFKSSASVSGAVIAAAAICDSGTGTCGCAMTVTTCGSAR